VTSCLSDIIVDSREPATLAKWWAETLGYSILRQSDEGWVAIGPWASESDRPDENSYRRGPQPPAIVFVPVADPRLVKNRVHLDIWPVDRTRDEEVAALLNRGAALADVGQGDTPWKVLTDPEGNVFCVLST
jgi:hypothetical protein